MALLLEIEKQIDNINKNKLQEQKKELKKENDNSVILSNEKRLEEFIKKTTCIKSANKIIINIGHKKADFLFDIKLKILKPFFD